MFVRRNLDDDFSKKSSHGTRKAASLRLPLETVNEDGDETQFLPNRGGSSTGLLDGSSHHGGDHYSTGMSGRHRNAPPLWRKRARLILPHVGLVVLSVFYTIIGATMFYFIEKPHEQNLKSRAKSEITAKKVNISEVLWEASKRGDVDSFNLISNSSLDSFRKLLFLSFEESFVRNKDFENNLSEDDAMWTFPSAVFFSATVITTIGYGHLVPRTTMGQVACVFFALLGIPLILVTTADMGKFLAEYVTSVYQRYEGCLAWIWHRITRTVFRCLKVPDILLPASLITTNKPSDEEDNLSDEPISAALKGFLDEDPQVPVVFVLLILISYTALGAFILQFWEDWTFFQSFYYCFITVTTVGFGDLVPQSQSHLLVTLLYIVIGLIITTMCIDLVGSQYIRKIHFFGRNIRKARYAFSHMGDRVMHLGEVLRYVATLQKKYGLTAEDLEMLSTAPDAFLIDCMVKGRPLPPQWQALFTKPFIPHDFPFLKWIDSRPSYTWTSERLLASLDSSEVCSTVMARTPRTPSLAGSTPRDAGSGSFRSTHGFPHSVSAGMLGRSESIERDPSRTPRDGTSSKPTVFTINSINNNSNQISSVDTNVYLPKYQDVLSQLVFAGVKLSLFEMPNQHTNTSSGSKPVAKLDRTLANNNYDFQSRSTEALDP